MSKLKYGTPIVTVTPPTPDVIFAKVLKLLQEFHARDPVAANAVFQHVVPTNDAVEAHDALVTTVGPEGTTEAHIGALGLINSILVKLGCTKRITRIHADTPDGRLIGFGVWNGR